MGQGIIQISLQEMAASLFLPEGYKPTGMYFDPASRLCQLVVESEELPEVNEYAALPNLRVSYTARSFVVSSEINVPK